MLLLLLFANGSSRRLLRNYRDSARAVRKMDGDHMLYEQQGHRRAGLRERMAVSSDMVSGRLVFEGFQTHLFFPSKQ